MKYLVALTLILTLFTVPAFAAGDQTVINNLAEKPHNTVGGKIDAPYLIKLTANNFIGVEAGKDVAYNYFFPSSYKYSQDDLDYFVYAKWTYTGTLLNFAK